MIISKKARKKEDLLKNIANINSLAAIAWTTNFVNVNGRYIEVMSNIDQDIAKKLRLTSIKKY